jgi:beta-1,4-mannosyl-glycoprotein beta-1,4-N-acetylglucosaminyltransferase
MDKRMKVYDCFTFFNELDLLEVRLEELYEVVDYFVIAEANMSHSGKPKDWILGPNMDRFAKFANKIRYLRIDDFPVTNNSNANVCTGESSNAPAQDASVTTGTPTTRPTRPAPPKP